MADIAGINNLSSNSITTNSIDEKTPGSNVTIDDLRSTLIPRVILIDELLVASPTINIPISTDNPKLVDVKYSFYIDIAGPINVTFQSSPDGISFSNLTEPSLTSIRGGGVVVANSGITSLIVGGILGDDGVDDNNTIGHIYVPRTGPALSRTRFMYSCLSHGELTVGDASASFTGWAPGPTPPHTIRLTAGGGANFKKADWTVIGYF